MKNVFILTLLLLTVTPPWLVAQSQRSVQQPMPARQVHLDFHTSEHIGDIGKRFNKKQWQQALRTGHVNQVNIFAKCHHSWSYYPTKIGRVHPNLTFDLLGAQMDACHEIGVKCPIYFTVGWSAAEAEAHPDWCIRRKDGSIFTTNYDLAAKPGDPKPYYSWTCLDAAVEGPYHAYVKKQVEEICQWYKNLDGFWFDIYHIAAVNYSPTALARMQREGVDINDETAVAQSQALALKAHMTELRELVARYHPQATVFFNTATRVNDSALFTERLYDLNTHQDLEDLPTTWGGYDKLPLESKYHLGQGTAATAMSGKFHKAWGEFGGFKHPDALKYEAAAMISYGVACNFGDQLHPAGEMDMETYRIIGQAYQYVETIEDYGLGGVPTANLGVWLTLKTEADRGVVNMLLELHHDFVFASEKNLGQLQTIIVPSHNQLTTQQATQLNDWVKKGGKLIVLGSGALNKAGSAFQVNIGAEYVGKSPFDFDFTVMKPGGIGQHLVTSPFLNYQSAAVVKPTEATVLATIRNPYFNRTYSQYSGHRETPYELTDAAHPAIIRYGNVIYFAHAIDQLYFTHGVRLHRDLLNNALISLHTTPMLTVGNLPSSGRVSFLRQGQHNRYVAHLLYAPALQRGEVTVIEDFLPVPNVRIAVRVPERVKSVMQIPAMTKLPFTQKDGIVRLVVPSFTMHTGIVFGY